MVLKLLLAACEKMLSTWAAALASPLMAAMAWGMSGSCHLYKQIVQHKKGIHRKG